LTVGFLEDFLGGLCPHEGMGAFVLSGDEGADGGGQFADVAEGSAVDGLALDDAEPTSTRLSTIAFSGGSKYKRSLSTS